MDPSLRTGNTSTESPVVTGVVAVHFAILEAHKLSLHRPIVVLVNDFFAFTFPFGFVHR